MDYKRSILITGGAGFIGFALAKNLSKENKNKIYIIDNLSRGSLDKEFKELIRYKNIKFLKADLTKDIRFKLKDLTHIFHLAGSVGVKNINKDSFGSFFNNVETLKNIIQICQNANRKIKFVLFSTSEVYSNLIKNNKVKFPIKETNNIIIENNIIKRDAYFLSKIFNEKIIQLSNIKYLILRPHNIYGPRMGFSHVIPELIKKFSLEKKKKKKNTIVFSPSHKRAFCYIDDAIDQIKKLTFTKRSENKIFNIGNMEEEITMFNLAIKLKNLIYVKSKIKKGKDTLGSPIRRIPDMNNTLKITKIKKLTSLNDGLKKTVNWYLKKK